MAGCENLAAQLCVTRFWYMPRTCASGFILRIKQLTCHNAEGMLMRPRVVLFCSKIEMHWVQ